MAKNVLKAWLVDNSVTTDKTDRIFQLETTRSIDKDIILDRMVAKNPGLHRETMSLGIELMEEVISEALMNGESELTVRATTAKGCCSPRGNITAPTTRC